MPYSPETVFERLDMLAQGSGLFRVEPTRRTARENQVLEHHPWRARLEALLEEAAEHKADWVYFRLVSDAGAPKPEVFIFDHTATLSDGGPRFNLAEAHRELWNYGKVPLAFVLRATAVDIFNLLSPPAFDAGGELIVPAPLETLALSPSDTLAMAGAAAQGIETFEKTKWQRFSGPRFDNGSFWDVPENRDLGSSDQSSVATMVEEMREVRRKLEAHFAKHHKLPDALAKYEKRFIHRMLILTLMVQFMEERGIIPPDYFKDKEHTEATDFKSLLLHRTPLLRAFDRLANDFNGDIFTLKDSTEPDEVPMREILIALSEPEKALSLLADFADGRMKGDEKHFWQRYSFRHLPVEAISYVYEDFLGNRSQSYFTPHHLVDLMLDEAMPTHKVLEAFRVHDPRKSDSDPAYPILDPSCGSGVFLVGAWHRLVEALYQLEPNPSPETLKQLMQQNIHGVDVEPDSVELTIFSLCVALCSAFPHRPDDPSFTFNKLRELKFPNLKSDARQRRNLHARDFFTERRNLMASPLRFQLIIGNPPFESKLDRDSEKAFDKLSPDESGKNWEPVPDNNISYLFLRAVPPLLADGGTACLVQIASLLYGDKTKPFRKALLENWNVPEILDFASVNGLFKKRVPTKDGESDQQIASRVKVVAVMVERRKPDTDKPMLHVTVRRTAALNERGVFEIDPQDMHWVQRDVAANDPRLWTADLLGGGRLLATYHLLTSEETFKDHISGLVRERGWIYKEGFTIGNAPKHHHPEMRDIPFIANDDFVDGYLDQNAIRPLEEEMFHRPVDVRLFAPPHLLIKENNGFPMVLRLDGDKLAFRHTIVGLVAPNTASDRVELERIYGYIVENRRAVRFFVAFGHQFLLFRQFVPLKKDLDDLPFPRNGKIVFNGIQALLRDDVLDFMIPMVTGSKREEPTLSRDSESTEVKDYICAFLEVMRSAFPDLRSSGEPHDLGRAWCVAFHRGDGKGAEFGDTEALKKHLDGLLIKNMGRSLRCWRIVRQFHGKNLYIVKPKPRRYWLKSAAVRDADEMFASWSKQVTKKPKA